MKFQATLLALFGLVATSPLVEPRVEVAPLGIDLSSIGSDTSVERRQSTSTTANELENGACRRITFIFARGSTESGNLVSSNTLVVRSYRKTLTLISRDRLAQVFVAI